MTASSSMRFGPEWMRQGPHNNVSEEGFTPSGIPQNKQRNVKNPQEHSSYSSILSLSSQPNNSSEPSLTPLSGSLRYSKEFLLSIWKDMLMSENGIPKPMELNQFSQVSSDEIIFPVSLSEMNEDEKKLFTGPVNSEQKRRANDSMNNSVYGTTRSYMGRVYSPRNERFPNNSRLDNQKVRSKDIGGNFKNLNVQKSRDCFFNTFGTELWTSPNLQLNSETPENNTFSNENDEIIPSSTEAKNSELENLHKKENENKPIVKSIPESSIPQINTHFLPSNVINPSIENIGSVSGRNVSRLQALGMFDSQKFAKVSSPVSATSSSSFQHDDSDDILKKVSGHISENKDDKTLEDLQNKFNTDLDINKPLENIQKEKTPFLGLFSPSNSTFLNQNNKNEKFYEHSISQQSSFSQPSLLQPQPSRIATMPNKLNWLYKDPMGVIQGPFSALKMQDWYKAGFFQPTLLVKQIDDEDFEPLSSLVRRVGNQKEPFLLAFPNKTQTQITPTRSFCNPIDGWNSPGLGSNLESQTPICVDFDHVGSVAPAVPTIPGWNHQSSFSHPFFYGSSLAVEQRNVPEHRKQEEQSLAHHKKDLFQQQQLTQFAIQRQRYQFQKQTQNHPEKRMQMNFLRQQEAFPIKSLKNNVSESIARNKFLNEEKISRVDKESSEFIPNFSKTVQEKLVDVNNASPIFNIGQRDLLNFTENPLEAVFSKSEAIRTNDTANVQKQQLKKDVEYLESPNTNQVLKHSLIKQNTESQKTHTHSIAPWANALDNIKNISLREIQESEVRNSQNRVQEIPVNQEYSKKVNSTKKEMHVISTNLPETATWGFSSSIQESSPVSALNHNTGCVWQSPNIPFRKKTFAEIQHEEELAQNVKVNKLHEQITTNTISASLPTRNYINSFKKPAQTPWITVGPDGRPISRSTITTSSRIGTEISASKAGNLDHNQKKPNVLKFNSISSTNQSSNLTNSNISENTTKSGSNDFLNWCKMSLKALNPGINSDDFLQMLMSLPVEPNRETIEIISDSIYANSAILDGRRFAEEFIRRRLENRSSDNGMLEKNTGVQSWTDALKSQKQKELEWNPVFKIVTGKRKQKEKLELKNM
ncbi:uncharacterized protein T551_02318 [Pneumocystis jirovecii RU7]|uniref:GYF domain-containing protein n=1 Tax=Pneumocystis jirovecii (strain RU7) TaxID=1408657 RepID=A0A0W4ZKZ0_PNEJ7|nr:uncharacterized protein T551_02318 [Pneumocystis jirovecii RU7]KTW29044.1 hypothetical protein T551_02318 [Pneumocystis jirovecii RU7]